MSLSVALEVASLNFGGVPQGLPKLISPSLYYRSDYLKTSSKPDENSSCYSFLMC